MTYVYPRLGLLIILPLLLTFIFISIYRKIGRDLDRLATKEVLPKIVDLSSIRLRVKKWILRLICMLLLVSALTGPGWGFQWQEIKSKGLAIIFALDTSKSMLAADIEPNRLERAKLAIADFLTKIEGNKVGLVAFAGTGFLQCPLTMDFNVFNAALASLSTESIPQGGTAIAEAIRVSQKSFASEEAGSKILILITDGENHEGNPVSIARAAAGVGIRIFTIGIGSPSGTPIPLKDENGKIHYLKDVNGITVKTKLNEKVLREIASAGKGSYLRGSGISMGLEELYQAKLAKFQQVNLSGKWQKQAVNRFQIPLLLAIIILTIEMTFGYLKPRRKQKIVPAGKQV